MEKRIQPGGVDYHNRHRVTDERLVNTLLAKKPLVKKRDSQYEAIKIMSILRRNGLDAFRNLVLRSSMEDAVPRLFSSQTRDKKVMASAYVRVKTLVGMVLMISERFQSRLKTTAVGMLLYKRYCTKGG